MKIGQLVKTVMFGIGILGVAGQALALGVYDTPATATGTRTVNTGGLVGGGNWGAPDNLSIAWLITPITGGFHYKYTLSGGFDQPGISHIILDLSDNCSSTSGCVTNSTVVKLEYKDDWGPAPSNPGFPANVKIDGIKFDDIGEEVASFVLEFDSNRSPVWGDIYVKGGSTSFAYNTALGFTQANHDSTTDSNFFVARPDTTGTPVPAPAALVLMLVAGVASGIRGRRSRQ